MNRLPNGFCYLDEVSPNILIDIKYATNDNFIGKKLPGYEAGCCIVTIAAAQALALMQAELEQQELGILVYDTYRPLRTVAFFYEWALDITDQKNKKEYYPNVNKKDFFALSYLGFPSSHCRGSTVDLTLVQLPTMQPLDMGTPFDFLDPLSHPSNTTVTEKQFQNRQLLQNTMKKYGFRGIETEWWHFTLIEEPFPDCYFDFPIVAKVAHKKAAAEIER